MEKRLLLEIGVEEVPAKLLPQVRSQLLENGRRLLLERGIAPAEIKVLGTPRRLVLWASGLPAASPNVSTEILGPPAKAAFDSEGRPTAAAIGFARSFGVPVGALIKKQSERGEYATLIRQEKGESTERILRRLLPDLISSLSFPKAMRWEGKVSFVRPIRWIAALLDGKIVPFEYGGIRSGNKSYGHRIVSSRPFPIWADLSRYSDALRRRRVIVDQKERRKEIERMVRGEAERIGGCAQINEALLTESVDLVENPCVISGGFDEKFLSLPSEVLSNVMNQQGYFVVREKRGDRLLPFFIVVANNAPKNRSKMIAGNERVLRARLVDAEFYFTKDRGLRLEERIDALAGITFLAGLGTIRDKAKRMADLADWLSRETGRPQIAAEARRGALLSKADLATGMVREFPDLQGAIGSEYARRDGEPEPVARLIFEHYLPRYAGDRLPATDHGRIVSIADKIDTITACFSLGLIPSGSEDPYALRRQGLGIVQIFCDAGWEISLRAMAAQAATLVPTRSPEKVVSEVLAFLRQRMASFLSTEGIRYDMVEAVLAFEFDRPHQVLLKARALAALIRDPAFFEAMVAFKRAIRIIPKDFPTDRSPSGLAHPAERDILETVERLEAETAPLFARNDFEAALRKMSELKPPIDRFFDAVLVMDPDADLRNNRLVLLAGVRRLFEKFGDLSKIVGAGTEEG